ncbi:hypothetical protein CCH79_00007988, partial [Gambusia affinis]
MDTGELPQNVLRVLAERKRCAFRAKTTPDNHLICVKHDLRSVDDKLSGNAECLASRAALDYVRICPDIEEAHLVELCGGGVSCGVGAPLRTETQRQCFGQGLIEICLMHPLDVVKTSTFLVNKLPGVPFKKLRRFHFEGRATARTRGARSGDESQGRQAGKRARRGGKTCGKGRRDRESNPRRPRRGLRPPNVGRADPLHHHSTPHMLIFQKTSTPALLNRLKEACYHVGLSLQENQMQEAECNTGQRETGYKLWGIPSSRILGTPLQDVNLLVIRKAAHPTKLPLQLKPGALYGPIRRPHGGLTADLLTRQLTPYEEGIFLLSRYIGHERVGTGGWGGKANEGEGRKIKFQIQRGSSDPTGYKSLRDCFRTIFRREGVSSWPTSAELSLKVEWLPSLTTPGKSVATICMNIESRGKGLPILGFYKGILPPILAETPKRAVKFFTYEQYKKVLSLTPLSPGVHSLQCFDGRKRGQSPGVQVKLFGSGTINLSPLVGLAFVLALSAAGLGSGLTEAVIVNPFEVVKVSLQANRDSFKEQPSAFAQARSIINSDGYGLRGLNKGLTSTLGRHGVFNMIYFGFYFNVKDAIPANPDPTLEFLRKFAIGLTSGTISSCANIPFDVAKSRIQGPQPEPGAIKYRTCFQTMALVYREEGGSWCIATTGKGTEGQGGSGSSLINAIIGGGRERDREHEAEARQPLITLNALRDSFLALYKGLVPKIMRLGPGGGVMLLVYEYVSIWLQEH